jgi:TATA-binding protein-associated factor Taf7
MTDLHSSSAASSSDSSSDSSSASSDSSDSSASSDSSPDSSDSSDAGLLTVTISETRRRSVQGSRIPIPEDPSSKTGNKKIQEEEEDDDEDEDEDEDEDDARMRRNRSIHWLGNRSIDQQVNGIDRGNLSACKWNRSIDISISM